MPHKQYTLEVRLCELDAKAITEEIAVFNPGHGFQIHVERDDKVQPSQEFVDAVHHIIVEIIYACAHIKERNTN